MASPAVRTSALTKDYGAGRGVFDAEFQVGAGEAFGLIGDEGSGKSTISRLLMGMIRPTRGSAYIFGLDCVREAVEIKRRVGYVPGTAPEFGSLRGGEVAAYMAGLRGGMRNERIHDLAQRLNLDLGRAHREYGAEQRQKLSLLLAFAHEPDLLILDEPAQGLGDQASATLGALIHEARDEGAAILLATRARPDVERYCETTGVLRRGKLARVMRIEELPAKLGEASRPALPP